MTHKTIYIKYRFSGLNTLVFADDNKWYLEGSLKQIEIRYKNGRNGIYFKRKFFSLKKLRNIAYKHTELLIEKNQNTPF